MSPKIVRYFATVVFLQWMLSFKYGSINCLSLHIVNLLPLLFLSGLATVIVFFYSQNSKNRNTTRNSVNYHSIIEPVLKI